MNTKKWKINIADPIKVEIYNILIFIKILICLLIIYVLILSFSEMLFTIENVTDNAFGYHKPIIKEKTNAI